MKKRALGRGLSALLPESYTSGLIGESVVKIPLESIFSNPLQPRKTFDEAALKELAESIKVHGVVQPVVCTAVPEGYRLIVGERRCRAARMAGLKQIPAIIRDNTGPEILELALIENIQREDLNPIEEAQAFDYLLRERGLTQEQLAERLGLSRPSISNSLRLLSLPDLVKEELQSGVLSAGHARVLLSIKGEQNRLRVWELFKEKGFSVRQAEQYVKSMAAGKQSKKLKSMTALPSEWQEIQNSLETYLGTPVRIRHGVKGKGRIELFYSDVEHFERLVELLIYLGERIQARPSLEIL